MKLRTLLLSCLVGVGIYGCADVREGGEGLPYEDGTDAPYDDEAEGPISSLTQAVQNGELGFAENESTGAVRFWTFNTKYYEWRNTCSGTLIANNRVVTAKHCLQPTAEHMAEGYPMLLPWSAATSGLAFVTHATAGSTIGSVSLEPGGLDGAILRLNSNVPVVVGTTRKTSGWKRTLAPIYGNALYFVAAFGLTGASAEPSTVCFQGTKGCWNDRRPMSAMFNYVVPHSSSSHIIIPYQPETGRMIASGDSGSGLLFAGGPGSSFATLSQMPFAGIIGSAGTTVVNGQWVTGGIALRAERPATNAWLLANQ
jgi:hypothetical protein